MIPFQAKGGLRSKIKAMFSRGEPGVVFNPNDTATLFEDASGTIPTALERPVGLMLDQSKGLVLGPNLVANGDFSTSDLTGWAGTAGIVVESNELKVTAASINAISYYTVPVTEGKWYRWAWDARLGTATDLQLAVYNVQAASYLINVTAYSSGRKSIYFLIPAGCTSVRIYPHATGTTGTRFFDNISVSEIPGNHATSSSTARPTLTRRVNLLTKTEQFDDSTVWNRTAAGSTIQGTGVQAVITADYAAGPFSGTLADRVQLNCGTGTTSSDRSGISQLNITTVATQYTAKIYVKPLDSTTNAQLLASNVGILAAGVAATSNDIVDIGSGWKLITRVYPNTVFAQSASEFRIQILGNVSPQTMDLLVWGADLRPANFGVNLPTYQRVGDTSVNAADYDTTGFPAWLRCSGGQAMVTPSINFGIDKITVWAGVRKLSGSGSQIILETSQAADTSANDGSFYFLTNELNVGGSSYYLNGTAYTRAITPAVSVPVTEVNSVSFDFTKTTRETETVARINGIQQPITGPSATEAGNGPFGNYPLYLFARNQSSLFFNGLAGPIIVRGTQSSPAEIANAENWINAQQKVYKP